MMINLIIVVFFTTLYNNILKQYLRLGSIQGGIQVYYKLLRNN